MLASLGLPSSKPHPKHRAAMQSGTAGAGLAGTHRFLRYAWASLSGQAPATASPSLVLPSGLPPLPSPPAAGRGAAARRTSMFTRNRWWYLRIFSASGRPVGSPGKHYPSGFTALTKSLQEIKIKLWVSATIPAKKLTQKQFLHYPSSFSARRDVVGTRQVSGQGQEQTCLLVFAVSKIKNRNRE